MAKAQIPQRRLPRNSPVRGSQRNGVWAKGDVTALTGLSRTSREVGIVEFGHNSAHAHPPSGIVSVWFRLLVYASRNRQQTISDYTTITSPANCVRRLTITAN